MLLLAMTVVMSATVIPIVSYIVQEATGNFMFLILAQHKFEVSTEGNFNGELQNEDEHKNHHGRGNGSEGGIFKKIS